MSDRTLLAAEVGTLLTGRGETIAVAESCTGGLIASLITDVPGASNYFDRGIVSYSNAAKVQSLNVAEALIAEHGAVSEQVARAMADGVRQVSGTTYGLATTGIAGPTGATSDKPVGTVHIALATPKQTLHRHECIELPRLEFKAAVAAIALSMVKQVLS